MIAFGRYRTNFPDEVSVEAHEFRVDSLTVFLVTSFHIQVHVPGVCIVGSAKGGQFA
jgi:hypothetical protein